jgi:cysteine sulfinate desulfinase/cysteine desulfurase-like protein
MPGYYQAIVLVLLLLIVARVCVGIGRMSSTDSTIIYLDNNATTYPHPEVGTAMRACSRLGNASSPYAETAQKIIHAAREDILQRAGVQPHTHEVIFTSGASESNNLFLRGIVDAYHLGRIQQGKDDSSSQLPHLILSAVEHKTSIECAKQLAALGRAEITLLPVRSDGRVDPLTLAYAIQPHTVAISIMHVNNETGAINDIDQIARIAQAHNIALHVDAVQSFAKFPLSLCPRVRNSLAAISVSFHKVYGPTGIGALIISERMTPLLQKGVQICGSQNREIRGGTDNLAGIAGAAVAMRITMVDRTTKNFLLQNMRRWLIEHLRQRYTLGSFENYVGQDDTFEYPGPHDGGITVVFLGPVDEAGLPHQELSAPGTLLVSFVKHRPMREHFCNIVLQRDLRDEGVLVSIGSACNSGTSSHVLHALRAPYIIRCGVVRISMGDYNTVTEMKRFCTILDRCVAKQQ